MCIYAVFDILRRGGLAKILRDNPFGFSMIETIEATRIRQEAGCSQYENRTNINVFMVALVILPCFLAIAYLVDGRIDSIIHGR